MNAERAQEIAFSPKMTNVIYNGEAIYIEHVDKQKGIAMIHPLNNPDNKLSISVDKLQEQ